jgi:hypothetical protein
MRLLHIYGGMLCPISFLCMKDLSELYAKGIRGDKMFVCETVDRNYTSVRANFYPNLSFCGAPKECPVVQELCNYIQMISSTDHTAESKFLGQYDRWCMKKVQEHKINLIEGTDIGTKTVHDKQIILDDLMSNHYLDLYKGTSGILIPSNELLNRLQYGWFVRMSTRQILESDTIIGNYLLLSMGPERDQGILEPLAPATNKAIEDKFVGFWKVPSGAPLWSLKPNFLGDNVPKIPYAGR